MAKINILFNGAEYAIDEANLAPATNALKAHFETLGGGEGGGSGLELGKEYKFKDTIAEADFEAYLSAIDMAEAEANGFVVAGGTIIVIKSPSLTVGFVKDGNGDYALQINYGDSMYAYSANTWISLPTPAPIATPTVVIPTDATMPTTPENTAVFFDIPSAGGSNEVTETVTADSEFSHQSMDYCYRIDCPIADIDKETFDGRIDNHYKVEITFNDGTAAKSFYLDGEGMNESGLVLMPADGPLAISNGTDIYAIVVEGNLEEVVGAEGYEFLKDAFPPNTILVPQSAFTNLHVETFSITYATGGEGNEGDLPITLDGAVYKVDSTKLAPATNSLIAHLETLKGGESGGGVPAFGDNWKFKDIITLADIEAVIKNYTPDDDNRYTLHYSDEFGIFINRVNVAEFYGLEGDLGDMYAVMYNPMTGMTSDYCLYNVFLKQETLDMFLSEGYVESWYTDNYRIVMDTPPVIESVPESTGINPEHVAPLFDVPGGGSGSGTLEYGKEYQFKKDITVEDFEHYIENATQLDGPSDVDLFSITIIANEDGMSGAMGTRVYYTQYPDRPPVYEIQVVANSMPQFSFRLNSINPELPDGWCKIEINEEDGTEIYTPIDTPPTVTILEDATMYADLATTAVFFDLGGGSGNEGDTKIVINGAEYWVDSAKLADAKSALGTALANLQSGGTN